ncbi:MAG: YceI family protein [Daejeonella sp.]
MIKTSYLLLTIVLFNNALLKAQSNLLLFTKTGEISFFSKASLEDIQAKNKNVTSFINTKTKETVVRVPITQFQFPNKLMQQHFNENYLESESYPAATFKGNIAEVIDFAKPGIYDVTANGTFTLHGVSNKKTLKGKLTIADNTVKLDSQFDILLADYKIDIPKLVFNKVAEKINITANLSYLPYKK